MEGVIISMTNLQTFYMTLAAVPWVLLAVSLPIGLWIVFTQDYKKN